MESEKNIKYSDLQKLTFMSLLNTPNQQNLERIPWQKGCFIKSDGTTRHMDLFPNNIIPDVVKLIDEVIERIIFSNK